MSPFLRKPVCLSELPVDSPSTMWSTFSAIRRVYGNTFASHWLDLPSPSNCCGSRIILVGMGEIVAEMGTWNEAESMFERVLKIDPAHEGALASLCACRCREGRTLS